MKISKQTMKSMIEQDVELAKDIIEKIERVSFPYTFSLTDGVKVTVKEERGFQFLNDLTNQSFVEIEGITTIRNCHIIYTEAKRVGVRIDINRSSGLKFLNMYR